MKKHLYIILIFTNIYFSYSQSDTNKIKQPCEKISLRDFSLEIFNAIKENNFEAMFKSIPDAPFDLTYVKDNTPQSFNYTQEAYNKWKIEMKKHFQEIIEYIKSTGASLNQSKLNGIQFGYEKPESSDKCDEILMEIKLNGINVSQRMQIRIEDCWIVNGKVFPEMIHLKINKVR